MKKIVRLITPEDVESYSPSTQGFILGAVRANLLMMPLITAICIVRGYWFLVPISAFNFIFCYYVIGTPAWIALKEIEKRLG